jgi:hypothetical protein
MPIRKLGPAPTTTTKEGAQASSNDCSKADPHIEQAANVQPQTQADADRPLPPPPVSGLTAEHDPNRNPDGSYIVGKCRTPEPTRWKKGQSGNPSGKRKPKPDLDAAIIELMEEPIVIPTAQGKKIKVTQAAALMKQTYVRAMKGDIRATKFLFETYAKAKAGKASSGASDDALSDAEQEMLKALLGSFGTATRQGDAS